MTGTGRHRAARSTLPFPVVPVKPQPRGVTDKRVLLVDDLIRSGATLGAVAAALGNAGAAIIFAFALTKTRRV
jgi:Predicted amidophosphoribosyltransferases